MDSEGQEKKMYEPKMLKGGLLDRPVASWIRILLVTTVWWLFVAGFFSLCFFLMFNILYGSEDFSNMNPPYFMKNLDKYPNIFVQPGLSISCKEKENCGGTSLRVTVNKIFNFKPEVLKSEDYPKELKESLEALTDQSSFDNQLLITCDGKKDKDKEALKGIKIRGDPGVPVETFPWAGKKDWEQGVEFDLSDSPAVKDNKKLDVTIICRAWAANIDRTNRQVDDVTVYGGGISLLCFKNGKVDRLSTYSKGCDD